MRKSTKTLDEKLKERESPIKKSSRLLVPSGCTLLDLACSDTIDGAWNTGRMINLCGEESSGKTLLYLTALAVVCSCRAFRDYRIVADDAEEANDFDIEELFGKELYDRIEPPKRDENGDPVYSETIEDVFANIKTLLSENKPFIYIVDSLDAVTSDKDMQEMDALYEEKLKGKTGSGSYSMYKQKSLKRILADIKGEIQQTKSLIIFISQVIYNVNGRTKYTRAGGKALDHYCSHIIWTNVTEKITKVLKGNKKIIGQEVTAEVRKNKLTGKVRKVTFPILYNYGIDNTKACIDFLITEGFWKMKSQTVLATDFEVEYSIPKLISYIEESQERIIKLNNIVLSAWTEIEEDLKPERNKRFKKWETTESKSESKQM
jgi:RecA/RadA recombinase